jgi:hypothetical protein
MPLEGPHIHIAITGAIVSLSKDVTTIGRGSYVDIRLADPSVSVLHAAPTFTCLTSVYPATAPG